MMRLMRSTGRIYQNAEINCVNWLKERKDIITRRILVWGPRERTIKKQTE
jgi:hypothetical protein